MFFYWMTVTSIGNLIDYVPVRMFSAGGDMFSLERGLGWSPWTALVVLGIPTSCVLLYFLLRIQPMTVSWLFPRSSIRRAVLIVLTGAVLWGFYGADGLVEGGSLAYQMSKLSVFVLLPAVTPLSWFLTRRRVATRHASAEAN
jgi:hypothetical protein